MTKESWLWMQASVSLIAAAAAAMRRAAQDAGHAAELPDLPESEAAPSRRASARGAISHFGMGRP